MKANAIVRLADRAACFVRWGRKPRTCFLTLRRGNGGPAVFSGKLAQEFARQRIRSTYRRLRSADAALIFSVSWGDWFHGLCNRWKIRTVLRVDGFMIPSYFDNRDQPSGYQDRRMSTEAMSANYRLQRDLSISDFVIYQSAFCKKMADHYLFNRRYGYAIVHNGIDLDRFRPGLKRLGRRRLLSMGSLRHEYMLGSVLPVFNRLWRLCDLDLLVVGSIAPICREQIDGYLQSHPEVADRIKVVGPVPNNDLPAYLSEADVMIHPRLGDWCPNTVIESMACGVPVVCGSWGGASELVGDGGVVVPTGEWTYGEEFNEGLARATGRILADLDQYKTNARRRAEQVFDIRVVAARYSESMGIDG